MKNWKKILIGIIFVELVRENVKQHRHLTEAATKLRQASELTTYLANMIETNDVPMDQYDSIAITTIIDG